MRIALYYPWVYLKGGPERTFVNLLNRSRHDWTILTSHYDADGTFPELKEMNVVQLPNRVSVKRQYGTVIRAAATIASAKLDLSAFDALVVGCDGLGSLINFRNGEVPRVCLCFTPLRAAYDEVYRGRHLSKFAALGVITGFIEWVYRQIDRQAWKRYDHVICISETVRQRVARAGLYPAERMAIAYPGVDTDHAKVSSIREPFFFLPGRIMWTKNIELAIDAFLQRKRSGEKPFRLVIAGMIDAKSQPYAQMLRERAQGCPEIEFIADPSDEQMADLYRRCYASLFTAFNEDWGLTPIEAMMHGKPVIAVNRGGPTETVVDRETGLLCPAEPSAFAAAMDELIDKPGWVDQMAPACVARAHQFSWNAFIEQVDGYFDSLRTSKANPTPSMAGRS